MKNRIGILIGAIALLFILGKIALLNKANDVGDYEVRIDGDRLELVGQDERNPKYNSTHQQITQTDRMSSETVLNDDELRTIINLDTLVHDKFAPMTDWGRDVSLNYETKEVSVVFSSAGDAGERIIGSIWPMGAMELINQEYFFRPSKWKKEHEEFHSLKEYLLTDIKYIDANGEIKYGNLKAFWDWRLNDARPFFFEEE